MEREFDKSSWTPADCVSPTTVLAETSSSEMEVSSGLTLLTVITLNLYESSDLEVFSVTADYYSATDDVTDASDQKKTVVKRSKGKLAELGIPYTETIEWWLTHVDCALFFLFGACTCT